MRFFYSRLYVIICSFLHYCKYMLAYSPISMHACVHWTLTNIFYPSFHCYSQYKDIATPFFSAHPSLRRGSRLLGVHAGSPLSSISIQSSLLLDPSAAHFLPVSLRQREASPSPSSGRPLSGKAASARRSSTGSACSRIWWVTRQKVEQPSFRRIVEVIC